MAVINQTGWGNVKVAIAGNQIEGITAIKYKKKDDKELLYGAGNKPIGVGKGNVSYEGSVSMYRYEVDRILQGIQDGEKSLGRVASFPITVMVEGSGGTFSTDIVTAQFMEEGRDLKQGDKMDIVELPLLVTNIQFNA